MNKAGAIELSRLKSLLMQDKSGTPDRLTEVLKSDLYGVLSGYADIKPEALKVLIDTDERGYHLIISVHTSRFKQIGMLPKTYNGKF